MLHDFFRYNVELTHMDDSAAIFQHGYLDTTVWNNLTFDADLESWNAENLSDGSLTASVVKGVEQGAILSPTLVGYTGRNGLYVRNSTLSTIKFPDYYKAYTQLGNARNAGFKGFSPAELQLYSGSRFPACNPKRHNWCEPATAATAGYWIPPQCQGNISACIEIWMGPPDWNTAYFEQLVRNTPVAAILAFHPAHEYSVRLHTQLVGRMPHVEDVVFFSWRPDPLSYRSLRISFPDGSNTCYRTDTGHPTGGINCDTRERVLMKLVSTRLIQSAPEAIRFLSGRFNVSQKHMEAMIGRMPVSGTEQIVFRTACEFVKNSTYFKVDIWANHWECILNPDMYPKQVYQASSGMCRPATKHHRQVLNCPNTSPPATDRSNITIRILRKNWLSHEIMEFVHGYILQDLLGYTVTYESGFEYVGSDWGRVFEHKVADLEPESWYVNRQDRNYAVFVTQKDIVLPPTYIGYSGRAGFYVSPFAVDEYPNADYYRFYQGPEAAQYGFNQYNSSEHFSLTENMSLCRPVPQSSWCYDPDPAKTNIYVPPICARNRQDCIQVVMRDPAEDHLWLEQLIYIHNLNIIAVYYGAGGHSQIINRTVQAHRKSLFYAFEPDTSVSLLGVTGAGYGRVSFPDWDRSCEDDRTKDDPTGILLCDSRQKKLQKIIRKSLEHTAPEAVYAMQQFEMAQDMIAKLIDLTQQGNGTMTTNETSCYFVQNYAHVIDKAAPTCIRNPKKPEDVRIGDSVWSPAAHNCITFACPANSKKKFRQSAIANQLEPGCEPCRLLDPGFVPDPDQMKCITCPPGKATSSFGDRCVDCGPGRYAEPGSLGCKLCPVGKYNPLYNASACPLCPEGGNCTDLHGIGGVSFFTAKPGYYILGSRSFFLDQYNAWLNSANYNADVHKAFQYVGPYPCKATGACTGNNSCLMSPDGTRPAMVGPLCGACAPGFQHMRPSEICTECPSMTRNWMVLVLGVLCFGAVLFAVDRFNASNVDTVRDLSAAVFKILCNFFILLSTLSDNIDLPSLLEEWMHDGILEKIASKTVLGAIGLGGTLLHPGKAIFSFPCLIEGSGNPIPPERFGVMLGWILVPTVWLVFTCTLGAWNIILRNDYATFRVTWGAVNVVILYFLHPMVTSFFLSLYECDQFDSQTGLEYDKRRMAINTQIDCGDPAHRAWMWCSAAGVLTWSFGVPLFFWFKLKTMYHSSTRHLQSSECRRVFGFIYDGFEPKRYYYECVFMLRKACYLIGATIPWLLTSSRTVILLAMNCLFLWIHLREQPFDNRAYGSLDSLEAWSSFTLITLLLGRVFQIMVQHNADQAFHGMNRALYLPSFASFVYFIFQALYLLIRSLIWPIDSHPWLVPSCIVAWMDKPLAFTMIPIPGSDPALQPSIEHCTLGSLNDQKDDPKAEEVSKHVASKERDMFKTFLSEAIEVLLQRHERGVGKAPHVICIHSFIVQLERLIAACMCWALKNRVVKRIAYSWDGSCYGFVKRFGEDTLTYTSDLMRGATTDMAEAVEGIEWHRKNCIELKDAERDIARPVLVEELHVALMNVSSKMTGKAVRGRSNTVPNVFRNYSEANKGLLDFHACISSLFEPSHHADKLDKHIAAEDDDSGSEDMCEHRTSCSQRPRMTKTDEIAPISDLFDEPYDLSKLDKPERNSIIGPTRHAIEDRNGSPEMFENRSLGHWSAVRALWDIQDESSLVDDQRMSL